MHLCAHVWTLLPSQRPFHTYPIDVRSKALTPELQATLSSQKNIFPNPYPKRARQPGDPCFCVSNHQLRQCPLGCLDGLSLSLPGSLSLLLHCEKIMARNLIWSQCQLPGVISASKCEFRMLRRWAYFTVETAAYDLLPTGSLFSLPGNRTEAAQTKPPGFGLFSPT